jgi:hypothetical protein
MKQQSEIRLELSEAGIQRIVIGADSDTEQAAAHTLLARVALELRQLDGALKTGSWPLRYRRTKFVEPC